MEDTEGSEEDFERFDQPLPVPTYYGDLRLTIARPYVRGNATFDAATIVCKFRHLNQNAGDHYESEIGLEQDGTGH